MACLGVREHFKLLSQLLILPNVRFKRAFQGFHSVRELLHQGGACALDGRGRSFFGDSGDGAGYEFVDEFIDAVARNHAVAVSAGDLEYPVGAAEDGSVAIEYPGFPERAFLVGA